MSEFSRLPIVSRMANLGFRLRLNAWDEEKRVAVVGWDVPKFVEGELPPEKPPCGFYFAKNERPSVEAVIERTARKSVWFYRVPYFFILIKFVFWKAVYFYFPHHMTKHEMSSHYVWNWMKTAEEELECKDRIKFWTNRRFGGGGRCLAPIDTL